MAGKRSPKKRRCQFVNFASTLPRIGSGRRGDHEGAVCGCTRKLPREESFQTRERQIAHVTDPRARITAANKVPHLSAFPCSAKPCRRRGFDIDAEPACTSARPTPMLGRLWASVRSVCGSIPKPAFPRATPPANAVAQPAARGVDTVPNPPSPCAGTLPTHSNSALHTRLRERVSARISVARGSGAASWGCKPVVQNAWRIRVASSPLLVRHQRNGFSAPTGCCVKGRDARQRGAVESKCGT